MPAVRDEAVCIRHWDWSETSQTVSLFGREQGLLRGLAKGARRERSRFGGGIDLLDRGDVGAILKSGTELATLTEWELLESFPRLRDDLWSNRAAFYAADLVQRMLAPHDPHPVLFTGFVELLRSLGGTQADPKAPRDGSGAAGAATARGAMALLRFQWLLLTETGYQPSLEERGPGGEPLAQPGARAARSTLSFSPRAGGVIEDGAPDAWRVRASTIAVLRSLDVTHRSGMAEVPEDAESIDRANRLLAAYVRDILGSEPPTLVLLFGPLGVRSSGGPRGSK